MPIGAINERLELCYLDISSEWAMARSKVELLCTRAFSDLKQLVIRFSIDLNLESRNFSDYLATLNGSFLSLISKVIGS